MMRTEQCPECGSLMTVHEWLDGRTTKDCLECSHFESVPPGPTIT